MEIYRLFAAIRPPSYIIKDLTRLQKGVAGARWSDRSKLHITLGFFGDVTGEQAELLDQQLADIRLGSFELTLSGTGHYGRAEPHSIWVGVNESDALNQLAKSVRKTVRACGVQMDSRDFRPHVTLAYLKGFPDVASVAKWEHLYSGYQSKSFLVDEFFLYSSWRRPNGANRYDEEASYPLLG